MRRIARIVGALAVAAALFAPAKAEAASIDIVVVVDESGSMAGEHAWLGGMISALDAELASLGYTTNYGLYGFGKANPGELGRELLDGGTAAQFATATGSLVVSGGFEDGYSGLNFAFNNFTFTAGAARNYILVTDEDRDNGNGALTAASITAALNGQNALLNAVVNNSFSCAGVAALGVDSDGDGYRADGSGGFTSCSPGTIGAGFGSTTADYVNVALATSGAAWDLNQLRAGGNTAVSFTEAFIDIKVQEITQQVVPEPGTMVLVGTALLGLAAHVRRRRKV